MLTKRYIFTETMTPFVDKLYGLVWFKREFRAHNPAHQAESIDISNAFLTPRLLSTRNSSNKTQVGFVRYQLNLVARQFGYC